MYAWGELIQSLREQICRSLRRAARRSNLPAGRTEDLDQPSPMTPLSRLESVKDFVPDTLKMDRAIYELSKLGFKLTGRGRLTVSMKCTRKSLKRCSSTELEEKSSSIPKRTMPIHSFYFPLQDAPWKPILSKD